MAGTIKELNDMETGTATRYRKNDDPFNRTMRAEGVQKLQKVPVAKKSVDCQLLEASEDGGLYSPQLPEVPRLARPVNG